MHCIKFVNQRHLFDGIGKIINDFIILTQVLKTIDTLILND
jgi:hypothetical protein